QQYWRALVMTDFDGRGWRVDRGRPEVPTDGDGPGDVAYTATLEPTRAHYLPVLDFPVGIPEQARLLDNLQVVTPRRIDSRLQYSGHARLDAPPAWPLSAEERTRALALPNGAAPRTRVQAGLWRTAHGDDDTAIVQEALQLFAGEPFRYTLRPPLLRGDRTDEFLFETRAGYCEHYASTLAVLMRAAGIPARVITGYQGGQWMDTGNYLRLRQADAHAWTEVWLDDRGWTRVDPTAAIAPERIEAGLSGWFGEDIWRSVLIALAVSLGGLALLTGLIALLRRPRDRRDPAQRALDRLSRRLRRHDLAREPHETATAYAARIREARPEWAGPLAEFAQAYTHLRYADLDTQEREQFQRQLWRALGEARR
ncbi:MAG: DUF3488 and transglutaminase-like domain-containing protein, partial [Thioalkalivibrio sp.]|nr:DUF3488 and transglutaminase-like domain-containing protein [Thioalkalivibrio sp.]